ncbi:hypothetical protein V8E54_001640 [Elaphomyces granulatus]
MTVKKARAHEECNNDSYLVVDYSGSVLCSRSDLRPYIRPDCRHTRRSYSVIGASKPQSFQPYSSSCLGRDFAGRASWISEAIATAMRWGGIRADGTHTAPGEELFCFEPKDNQVEAIQHLLCDRNQILITETGFGRVEAFELNHYALEEEQAEKLKRMAGALNGDTNTRKKSVQVSTIHTYWPCFSEGFQNVHPAQPLAHGYNMSAYD